MSQETQHDRESSRCTERTIRAPAQDMVPHQCSLTAADSSALQTSAEINEAISETLKWRAKEFMNLSLLLLTVHRQVFQKARAAQNRPFVLPQCWQLFAHSHLFSRQLKGRIHRLEDLLFEWSLFIHPRQEFIQEITARNISLFMQYNRLK